MGSILISFRSNIPHKVRRDASIHITNCMTNLLYYLQLFLFYNVGWSLCRSYIMILEYLRLFWHFFNICICSGIVDKRSFCVIACILWEKLRRCRFCNITPRGQYCFLLNFTTSLHKQDSAQSVISISISTSNQTT